MKPCENPNLLMPGPQSVAECILFVFLMRMDCALSVSPYIGTAWMGNHSTSDYQDLQGIAGALLESGLRAPRADRAFVRFNSRENRSAGRKT
jgi:hypothetical protein